jgi:putative endonuclease
MYYVYIIKDNNSNKIYIGYTSDLKKRIKEHSQGKPGYTKSRGPWELIYYEAFKDRKLARKRELSLKYFGKAYGQLKGRISLYDSKGAG